MEGGIKIDTNDVVSGSMAYNRLEMQISQSLLFAIELYEQEDFLITLDYFDDITIFSDETMNSGICYYQMKSNESITLNYILKEDWLTKLYMHLFDESDIKEIGLIVCNEIKHDRKKLFTQGKIELSNFGEKILSKVKLSLSEKFNCEIDEIDLSKFVFIKTVLTKDTHREFVENAMSKLLMEINPDISVRTAYTVFTSLLEILTNKQSIELPEFCLLEDVKNKKSMSKKEFDKVIKYANKITLPDFQEINRQCYMDMSKEEKYGIAFSRILSDSKRNQKTFYDLLDQIVDCIANINKSTTILEMTMFVKEEIKKREPRNIHILADDYYIETLALCMLVKGDIYE
ncbi:hypothetical protein ACIZ62_12805 [Acetobacterium carbinolicum]|uniref:hypothetical protein n=1 Tax=Acetobacterium carbinolicum TaxID=52690 RepID=UPI0039BEEC4A